MGAGASATSMTSQNGLFEKQKMKAAKKKKQKSSTPVVPPAEDSGLPEYGGGADGPRQQESTGKECKGGRKTQTATEMTLHKVKQADAGDESDVEPLHV